MNTWIKYIDQGVRSFPEWVAIHPLRFDLILFGVIVLLVVFLLGRQKKATRRAHRIYRGIMMRRENLTAWQRMRFEDAIIDCALDMNLSGEITDAQEKEWYRLFAVKMGMDGMVPRKSNHTIKKAIKTRLYKLRHDADVFAIAVKNGMAKAKFWGPKPGSEIIVDTSYIPSDDPAPLTSSMSKFAKKVA